MIKHIVAMTFNRAIGCNNKLPWHLPEDLKHFKEQTLGKTIYMGTNTFRSILSYSKNNEILPGRKIRVISSSPVNVQKLIDEYGIFPNVDYWTKPLLDMHIQSHPKEEIIIVGGVQLYATYPPDEVLCTYVRTTVKGADSFYPHDISKFHEDAHSELRTSVTGLTYSIGYYSKNP